MNAERKKRPLWIAPLERPFFALRHPRRVQFGMAAVLAAVVAVFSDDVRTVGLAGAAGIATYGPVKFVALRTAAKDGGAASAIAHAVCVVFERALAVFLLLEVLDDTYSFTSTGGGLPAWERFGIALAGVGIGAVFLVRLTRRLDTAEALTRYAYLPAGAAYVLGVLGLLLWASLFTTVPNVVAAWFGSAVIGASFVSSLVHARRTERR